MFFEFDISIMSKAGSPDKTDHHHFQAYLSQGTREGGLILTVALCIFLVMALVSYNPQDPGWASTGSNAVASNYGGRAGAWFADVLLYFFGYVSYLFPLLIGYRAVILFKNRRQRKSFHWPMLAIRVIGFIMTVLGATGLLALYSISGLDDVSGGVIGSELAEKMDQALNLSGSTLSLVSMLLIGLTVFTGISWLGLMDRTGALTIALYERLHKLLLTIWDNYQDKRQLQLEGKAIQLKYESQKVVI
ncbi:MAG: S-DNA-T family DNA segregation ATPase FtsK/SpoIIIE, partial [Pseudohongiellaceae bacterium]